jgi:hypothetical protein
MATATARFPLGQIVATPGALAALGTYPQEAYTFLLRHQAGDWGEVDQADARENELSVDLGYRILSAYTTRTGTKVWVITEADRSTTTLLLPEEY